MLASSQRSSSSSPCIGSSPDGGSEALCACHMQLPPTSGQVPSLFQITGACARGAAGPTPNLLCRRLCRCHQRTGLRRKISLHQMTGICEKRLPGWSRMKPALSPSSTPWSRLLLRTWRRQACSRQPKRARRAGRQKGSTSQCSHQESNSSSVDQTSLLAEPKQVIVRVCVCVCACVRALRTLLCVAKDEHSYWRWGRSRSRSPGRDQRPQQRGRRLRYLRELCMGCKTCDQGRQRRRWWGQRQPCGR